MSERLRITGVRTVVVGADRRDWVFVLIDTDAGITGLGEASLAGQTHAVLGAVKDFEPLLIGADAFRTEHLWQLAHRDVRVRGDATFHGALAGIEVALWDIKGKALGVPLYRLLGGVVRDRIRVSANGPRGQTPDEYARSAADLVARGFTALTLTPFDPTPTLDGKRLVDAGIARVRAVRDAVGPDVDLIVDAGGSLSPPLAVRCAAALAPFGIMFLAEPSRPDHVPVLIRIAEKSPIPIALGGPFATRSVGPALLASRAIAVLQPDIGRTGGLAEARRIATLAESHFVSIAPLNSGSLVNTVAALHLDAVTPNFLIQDVSAVAEPWHDVIVAPPRVDARGYIQPPGRPGLGVELDLEAAKRFPPGNRRARYGHQAGPSTGV
ncbi:MAG TPA: mandelate racemase/muconate lactonizing enzyme family protein [Thermomicrobiales bacterium]